MLETRQGDIFEAVAPGCFLMHGCNAKRVMESGVAKQVRRIYPEAYDEYMTTPYLRVGEVIFKATEGIVVANCITQQNYGKSGTRYVDYDAVYVACKTVAQQAKDKPILLPLIGGGLGGGKIGVLLAIFERVFKHSNATLYVKEPYENHSKL